MLDDVGKVHPSRKDGCSVALSQMSSESHYHVLRKDKPDIRTWWWLLP